MVTTTAATTLTGPVGKQAKPRHLPLFIDADALAAELRKAVRGEVRFDNGSRAGSATDGSNYRQVPIGVVIPANLDDVITTVDICRRHDGTPFVARRRHQPDRRLLQRRGRHRLVEARESGALDFDPAKQLARVQPGTVLDVLRAQAEKYQLTFDRPLDAHAQHARRDDRQQLLRRPFAHGIRNRADLPTRFTSSRSCSTTARG